LAETKKCFNSTCNNNLENQLNVISSSSVVENKHGHGDGNNNKLSGNKRARTGGDIAPTSPQKIDIPSSGSKSDKKTVKEKEPSFQTIPLGKTNLSSSVINLVPQASTSNENLVEDGRRFFHSEGEVKNAFPNINETRRSYLVNLIEKIEKANNIINKSLPDDEKTRRSTRDKICFALVSIYIVS
jgi:hypothetical protein